MFGSKEKKDKKPRVMERNFLAKNTKIIGDIISDGDFRIDGVLEGTLKTNGRIIIGSEGLVKGNVEASNADIEGKFTGQLQVDNTLSIKATAVISGDVVIGKLSVEPGATFNATCVMKGTVKELNKSKKETQVAEKSIS